MAAKRNINDIQSNIEKLNQKIEEEKALLLKLETEKITEIGKTYFAILKLNDKDITLDQAITNVKNDLKNKKEEKKNKL